MRSASTERNRGASFTGALLLAPLLLLASSSPTPAQTADEEAGTVAKELQGIRTELRSISQLLQTLEKHQQVAMLMARIRLKQQRLGLLESLLREARDDETDMEQEIEHLEAVEQSYLDNMGDEEFGSESHETMRGEIEFLTRQKENVEARLQTQRATVVELENDLMRAREDVLTLEETVDERLGLR